MGVVPVFTSVDSANILSLMPNNINERQHYDQFVKIVSHSYAEIPEEEKKWKNFN